MNYNEYRDLFDTILTSLNPIAPYNDSHYVDYTKLNKARMRRWDGHMELNGELVNKLKSIQQPQHWIIITEHWCGDAAHSVPFLCMMAELNPLFTYEIQLRDAEPFLINNYLTNGSKGIPKLIVRNENGEDLYTWGPRPAELQIIRDRLMAEGVDLDDVKTEMQKWYNNDKGRAICKEILELI